MGSEMCIRDRELRTRDVRAQGATPRHTWATDYAAMASAKAIRQLIKYLPQTVQQGMGLPQSMFDKDEEIEGAPMDDVGFGM